MIGHDSLVVFKAIGFYIKIIFLPKSIFFEIWMANESVSMAMLVWFVYYQVLHTLISPRLL